MNLVSILIMTASISIGFAGDCSKLILKAHSGFSYGDGLNRYIFIFMVGPISIDDDGTLNLRVKRLQNSGGGYEDVVDLKSEENRDILFHINFLKARIPFSTKFAYKVVVTDGEVSVFRCNH